MPGGPGGPCKTESLSTSLIVATSLRSFPVQLGPYSKHALSIIFKSTELYFINFYPQKLHDAKQSSWAEQDLQLKP